VRSLARGLNPDYESIGCLLRLFRQRDRTLALGRFTRSCAHKADVCQPIPNNWAPTFRPVPSALAANAFKGDPEARFDVGQWGIRAGRGLRCCVIACSPSTSVKLSWRHVVWLPRFFFAVRIVRGRGTDQFVSSTEEYCEDPQGGHYNSRM